MLFIFVIINGDNPEHQLFGIGYQEQPCITLKRCFSLG